MLCLNYIKRTENPSFCHSDFNFNQILILWFFSGPQSYKMCFIRFCLSALMSVRYHGVVPKRALPSFWVTKANKQKYTLYFLHREISEKWWCGISKGIMNINEDRTGVVTTELTTMSSVFPNSIIEHKNWTNIKMIEHILLIF